jgi:nicotinate-nucleotide pyrophosphorylase
VLCGTPFAQVVFDYFELQTEWLFSEGEYINTEGSKVIVAKV